MSVKATDSQIVIYASADVESSAIEVAGIVLDDDMPEVGGATAFMRATLKDGTERCLVLFAIEPAAVEDMASNQDKRDAIAEAIEAAAQAL
tara:strand:- start:46 stop:318 length:273 start_codon:yes stop_codon:yes gene_type:complete